MRFSRPGARRRGGAAREQALTAVTPSPPAAQTRAAGTVIPDLQADPSFNVLDGHVDTHSAQFRESTEYMAGLTEELHAMLDRVRRGGGERAVERHRSRGKLLPRERIDAVLDAECVAAARRVAGRNAFPASPPPPPQLALPRALTVGRTRGVRR